MTQQYDALIVNLATERQKLFENLFGTKRDIDEECNYPSNITTEQYTRMYEREPVAARVVDLYPEECWAEDPMVKETADAEETAWEKAWNEHVKQHNVYHYLERIDKLSGIGHFGVLLFGLNDGGELHDPVPGIKENGDIDPDDVPSNLEVLYIRTFDENLVKIEEYEKEVSNRRFGQPTMYTVSFADPNRDSQANTTTTDYTQKKVHWSRLLHVADNRTSNEFIGTPRQKKVFNRLMDLRKIFGGSGEMFWKGGFPGLAFEVDPTMGDVDLDKEGLRSEVEAYQNGLQRYLALSGLTAKSLEMQVADPTTHIDANVKVIALAMGCPARVLMGTEEAKLASGQDAKAWAVRVNRRQTKYCEPMLLFPYIERLIAYGVLPMPQTFKQYVDIGLTVEWPDKAAPTDADKMAVIQAQVEAISKYITSGASELIPPMEFMTIVLEWDVETAEAVLEAAEERLDEEEGVLIDAPPEPNAFEQGGDINAVGEAAGLPNEGNTTNPPATEPVPVE